MLINYTIYQIQIQIQIEKRIFKTNKQKETKEFIPDFEDSLFVFNNKGFFLSFVQLFVLTDSVRLSSRRKSHADGLSVWFNILI